jgi:hypothetical protein
MEMLRACASPKYSCDPHARFSRLENLAADVPCCRPQSPAVLSSGSGVQNRRHFPQPVTLLNGVARSGTLSHRSDTGDALRAVGQVLLRRHS